jgi:Fe-S cluster biogenesis protein NfuA
MVLLPVAFEPPRTHANRPPTITPAPGGFLAAISRAECGNVVSVSDVASKQVRPLHQVRPSDELGETTLVGVNGQVMKALAEFVAALVRADGGELYVVSATSDDVHLHLTGTCAGCPGATMTRERLLEPAVRGAAPKATVKVTTGWRVPEGAQRVG